MTTLSLKRRSESKRAVSDPKPRKPLSAGRVLAWVVLWAFILLTVFSFFWMIRTGLSNGRSLAGSKSMIFILARFSTISFGWWTLFPSTIPR
jgi:multiple sugar transport system permease protein